MEQTNNQEAQQQTPQAVPQDKGKPQEQPQATAAKTYSQEEVNKLLEQQKKELRERAVAVIEEKNKTIATAGQDEFFDLTRWEVMKKMANDMVQSGALPRGDNAYTVMMKMQAGREMGMKPTEAINSLYIVNGVITIWGKAVTKRIRNHGWRLEYIDEVDKCTAIARKGDEEYQTTFAFQMAEESGWTKTNNGGLKIGWVKGANRTLKLGYGALSMLIKRYIPEVMDSVAEIAEVAEDTVPLYEQQEHVQGVVIPPSEDDEKPATDAQKKTILALAAKNGVKVNVEDMTQATAKAWIAGVNQK